MIIRCQSVKGEVTNFINEFDCFLTSQGEIDAESTSVIGTRGEWIEGATG